jgi:predicted phosphatase
MKRNDAIMILLICSAIFVTMIFIASVTIYRNIKQKLIKRKEGFKINLYKEMVEVLFTLTFSALIINLLYWSFSIWV